MLYIPVGCFPEKEKGVTKKIYTLSREDVSEPAQVIDMARLSQHNNLDDLTQIDSEKSNEEKETTKSFIKAFQDNLVPLIPKGVKKFMITDSPDQPIVHKEYFRLIIMQKCLDFILMKASREKNYKILFNGGNHLAKSRIIFTCFGYYSTKDL